MKIGCLLTLLFFSSSVQSQTPANEIAPEDVAFNTAFAHRSIPVITGKLLNITAAECKNLPISYTLVTPFSTSQATKTTSARPDGTFRLELDYPLPYQQVWFGVGEIFYAALYANKDLYLELDMKKIKEAKEVNFNGDGVRYLGTDGPLNVYMNNYILYKREEQMQLSGNISRLIYSGMATDTLLPKYNKLYDSVKGIEDSYIAANPSPYSWILENERMSEYYGHIAVMYWGKTMSDSLWQKMNRHKSYLVSNGSAGFYNYMATYIHNLSGNRFSVYWKDIAALPDLTAAEKALTDSLRDSEKMQQAYPYTTENQMKWFKLLQPRMESMSFVWSVNKSIRVIDSLFTPAKADFLKLRLNTSKDINDQKLALERILGSMHTAWCMALTKKEWEHTVAKIDEINKILAKSAGGTQNTSLGKPLLEMPFGASLYKAPAIKALDFVAKLKQSFPGKAIIIDRWATWCGPCLSEMPHSKSLQETSKDLPVVFVYLCTLSGSTEGKWKSKVAELQQPGIHVLIDEALDAELSDYFSFSGYPGYAFIDKTGHYRPGAIKWMSAIADREALSMLINR